MVRRLLEDRGVSHALRRSEGARQPPERKRPPESSAVPALKEAGVRSAFSELGGSFCCVDLSRPPSAVRSPKRATRGMELYSSIGWPHENFSVAVTPSRLPALTPGKTTRARRR